MSRTQFACCVLCIFLLTITSQISHAQLTDSLEPTGQQVVTPRTNHAGAIKNMASRPRQLVESVAGKEVTFQGMLVSDWSKNLRGSVDSSDGFGRYSLDFSTTLDAEKLLGWKGATGFVRLKHHINEFGYNHQAAAQVPSNIDASSRTTLYELWLQQTVFSEKLRLKFGKIDANTEFDVVQSAGDFLNSSMGYSPTIMAFPSYPEPKPALGAFYQPVRNYQLGLGVFETSGSGTLSVVEPGHNWAIGERELPGRASVGYWRLDGSIHRFDGGQSSLTQGYYSVLEQSLWRGVLAGEGNERRLSAFLQFGQSDGNVNALTEHLGAGTVLLAPFGHRPHDSVGLAATRVHFSSHPNAGFDRGTETILESYYKVAITPMIAVVQDFQFLHHPGGLHAHPDCLMVTPRLAITF